MNNLLSQYFLAQLNLPYIWGGENPLLGFDCSGLVQYCLRGVGMDPPLDQTAQALYRHFHDRGHPIQEPQEGAFAFYGGSLNHITHVAYALNKRIIIEAGGGDATTKTIKDAQKRGACVRLRPWNYRKDCVAVLLPKYEGV